MNSIEIFDENRIKAIANRIKESRKKTSISLQEMADYIGIGYEQYRRIEAGNVLVKTEYLISIASVLSVSTDYLLLGKAQDEINSRELASFLNDLSSEDTIRALRVLRAVFI